MRSLFFIFPLIMIPFVVILIPGIIMPTCDGLTGYNKDNSTASTGAAKACVLMRNQVIGFVPLIIFPVVFLPLIMTMKLILGNDDDDQVDKKLIKQLENEIPNVTQLEKIPCALCSKNVDRPYNLIKHLGVEQTKEYLAFCEETKTKPTLYCCRCYAMVERNPDWQKAMDSMIDDSIKYGELKKINLMKIQEKKI